VASSYGARSNFKGNITIININDNQTKNYSVAIKSNLSRRKPNSLVWSYVGLDLI